MPVMKQAEAEKRTKMDWGGKCDPDYHPNIAVMTVFITPP
jgi:hypothetical protein